MGNMNNYNTNSNTGPVCGGRAIGDIYFKDKLINEILVQAGLACVYRNNYKHPNHYKKLIKAEKWARKNKKGFWAKYSHIPDGDCPCDY